MKARPWMVWLPWVAAGFAWSGLAVDHLAQGHVGAGLVSILFAAAGWGGAAYTLHLYGVR